MRRALILVAAVAALLGALAPGTAMAHPLGNFSVNHLDRVRISDDRVEVRYILDQAEIPTFQERDLAPEEVLARKRAEVRRGLALVVDGRRVALRFLPGATIAFPQGQGGLKTTRVELPLVAEVGSTSGRVELRDETFPGRVGWKAIVAAPGEDTAVRSSAPSGDPTNGLRAYPQELLKSPLDQRRATFSVRAGDGTLVAPKGAGEGLATTRDRGGDGFAGVFSDAADGDGVLLFLLLAAFAWGAFHALSPGHGKAMVAAYLVGTRGTARHAVALGATVTVTHTIGVFSLGLVTLLLSQYVLPEDLYPWLNLASGLLVVGVGAAVLRSRIRGKRQLPTANRQPDHHHHHEHSHDHDHSHGAHSHSHELPDHITWKGLLAMGASAGLIPCPSALVVLLGAIAQHQVALGLLLIVAFSFGLAATLTAIGLVVVFAQQRIASRVNVSGRVATALPAVSALIIIGAGVLLTAQAVPQLGG